MIFRLVLAIFITVLGAASLGSGLIKSVFLLSILLVIFCWLFYKGSASILFYSVAIFLTGIIRWNATDEPVSAAFSTILELFLILGILVKPATRKKVFSRSSFFLLIPLTPHLAIISLNILADSTIYGAPFVFFAAREYVFPFLSYFLFRYFFLIQSVSNWLKIFSVMYFSVSCVAIINIIHYLYSLPLAILPFVPVRGSQLIPEVRSWFGITVPRLNPIFGVGSQGGGASIYGTFIIIGLVLFFFERKLLHRFFLLAFLSPLLIAVSQTVAFSALVAIFIGLTCLILAQNRFSIRLNTASILGGSIALLTLALLASTSVFEFGTAGPSSPIAYGLTSFILPGASAGNAGLGVLITGQGLGLNGSFGVDNNLLLEGLFDRWLFGALIMVGLFSFLSIVFSYIYWFSKFIYLYRLHSPLVSSAIPAITCSLVLLSCGLTYSHQPALMVRIMIPLSCLALACLSVSLRELRSLSRVAPSGEPLHRLSSQPMQV
jgi:hypothetical protein